jgi:hypothetical protein
LSEEGLGFSLFFTQWLEREKAWPYAIPLHRPDKRPDWRDHTWLCAMYVAWNRYIERQANNPYRVRVENGRRALFNALGMQHIPLRPSKYGPWVHKKLTDRQKDEWKLGEVEPEILADFNKIRIDYGYARLRPLQPLAKPKNRLAAVVINPRNCDQCGDRFKPDESSPDDKTCPVCMQKLDIVE